MTTSDSNELTITPESIHEYCKNHTTRPSATLLELTRATQTKSNQANMQVGHIEGQFLSIITGLMSANRVLEFGTFTGYSALSFAEALPDSGRVTTLDRDPVATQIAQEYWDKSPHGKKIELILGDAQQTILQLQSELQSRKRPAYDLAFIDADKAGYTTYWEAALKLVRKGGAIIVDNVLWSGRVLNPTDASDFHIVNFNKIAIQDPRVDVVMLPIRDGIILAKIK
jgi:caffeoyl-CoA O-methyltransferase